MENRAAQRTLIRAGFVLFSLALVTGLAIPAFHNPKMALAAHVTGVLNALVLIALGLTWGPLAATPSRKAVIRGMFLYATFVNWGGSCLAAAWGTTRLTPLTAAGFGAAPWQEAVVAVFQISIALTILPGAALVVVALRARPEAS